ncbi:MAG: sugar transferase [Oscillospiraceae bacterium]|nr:sugar transferase [Ruminococcus sp.]MDY6061921.1 sugar transferase [Oscillospiraceae bacterium]
MYKYFKRIMDFVASLTALIILSPLIALSAVLVKISDGGSVIFKQRRPGKDGKIFTVYKFRTMSEKTEDENGRELSDVERMTKIGSFLRKTSLDELPQLFNVLKGDMSFIGPRPLLCEYLELYTPYQMRRHEVLPGISGLAQVNGRNAITWEEKFDYDVYYVDHMSFWLDLRILFKTIKNTLKRADINCSDNNTMEKFRGTPAAKEKR